MIANPLASCRYGKYRTNYRSRDLTPDCLFGPTSALYQTRRSTAPSVPARDSKHIESRIRLSANRDTAVNCRNRDAEAANCRRTVYGYGLGNSSSFANRIAEVDEVISGKVVERTEYPFPQSGVAANFEPIEIAFTGKIASDQDDNLVSNTKTYADDAAEPYKGRTYQYVSTDGSVITYDYELGSYDPATRIFTPGDGDTSERTSTYRTSLDQPDGTPFVSTKELSVEVDEQELLSETYLFTGGDNFVLLSQTAYVYDGDNLSQTIRDGRVVHEQTWANDELQSEIGSDGIETTYTYWPDGDIKTATRTAGGGFPASVTTYTYADGNLVSQSVTSGGLTRSQSWDYQDGDLVSSTDINGHIHPAGTSSDDPANRTRTYTDGNGNATVTTTYRDRQTKSVTGAHIVDRHYTYSVEDDGTRVTEVRFGAPGSPRFTRTFRDKLGQIVKEERPTFGGAGVLSLSRFYANEQLTSSDTPSGASSLQQKLGENHYRSGLDKDGNGTLDFASTDQVSEQRVFYQQLGGDWYRVTEYTAYLTDGDAAPTVVSRSKSRVTGLGANIASHTIHEDHLGNQTTTIVEIDRPAKTRTVRIIRPGVDGEEVRVYQNGYLKTINRPGVTGQTIYTYDALGRVTHIQEPATGLRSLTYFGTGNLVETDSNEIDPPTTYAYYGNDSAHRGRVQSITDGNGGTIFLDYDDRGNEDHRWGTATYEIKRTYNLFGQLEQLQTFRNPGQPDTTTWHYDPATGLLHQKEYADHKHVTYDYWPNGQVKTRLWARGITTSYAYDNAGTLETVTYSDDTPSITYTRDRNGRIDTVSDAAGLHTLDHRPDGQLLSSASAGGLLDGWQIVYQPDALGRTEGYQVKNNGQNVAAASRGYDTAGRLGTLSTGDNEVRYRYDPVRGLRTGTDHYHKTRLALSNDRAFDAAGRIDFVQSRRRDNATILLRDYTLDDLGRRERADDEEGGHWAYGYNDRSEVVGGTKHRPNGDAIPAASFAYDFDGIGNRKTHTIGDLAPVSYTANNLNQYAQVIGNEQAYIVGRTAEGAAVTINGQPAAVEDDGFFSGLVDLNNDSGPSVTEVTIDADKAGKQTQETGALRSAPASATWQYDDDGNLLSDGLWDYTWNGENRLIAAETVATIPAAYRVKKEYVYDYRGRRVEETKWKFDETSNDYSLEQQLRSIYDDWNPVVEIVDDQPSRHYVWGLDLSETPQGAGGVAGLLMSLDLTHASLSYSFVYDGNGNVLGVTNLANGELIGRYEYSPFGKLLWKEGLAAEINRWRFSTKLGDDSTGWLYYGYRYYASETGRWLSRDPIEEMGGTNLYAFVRNQPISWIDLLGREPVLDPSGRGSQWRDPNTGRWTSPPSFPSPPTAPTGPRPENPAGRPSTGAGGLAGLADMAANAISNRLPGKLKNDGWKMCDSQVPYSLGGALRQCCCCIINIHMLKQPGIGRNMPIPGMPATGNVVRGSCAEHEENAARHGTIGPFYWPISGFRQWLHDNLDVPLPRPPEQVHRIFYEDWGCPE